MVTAVWGAGSQGPLFALNVARNVFDAAAETALGAALVDWTLARKALRRGRREMRATASGGGGEATAEAVGRWQKLGASAGGLQAVAFGARYVGTLAATGVASALFPCNAARQPLSARAVLALAAAPMALAALVSAAWLPEARQPPRESAAVAVAARGPRPSGTPLPLVLFIGVLQVCAAWVGMRPLVPHHAWTITAYVLLAACAAVLATAAAATWVHARREAAADETAQKVAIAGAVLSAATPLLGSELHAGSGAHGHSERGGWLAAIGRRCAAGRAASLALLPSSLYVLLSCAAPSAIVQWGAFEYAMFGQQPCKVQALSTLSAVASLGAAALFGTITGVRGWSLAAIAALGTVAAAGAALLPLPLAQRYDGDPSSAGVSAFWWVAAIHIVQTVVAQVAFLPRPAVALEAAVTVSATVVKANVGDAPSDGEEECSDSERNIAPSDSPGNDASLPVAGAPTGAVYGALLSMLDLGDTVSGWLTAPLVASLGLTFDDWSNMPALLWTGAGCRLATLALVPLLLVGRNTRRKLARQAQRRSDRLEDSEGGLGATAPLAV